jgi:hypothetical protein
MSRHVRWLALLLPLCGCDETKPTTAAPDPTPSATAMATATAAATAATAVAIEKGEHGKVVTIPKGTLKAGSRCMDVPRSRENELLYEDAALGEFQMDMHPYPNEPGKPAMVNVTWEKAKELCEQRGKRLCTEMEWERACKGPSNATYMWGGGFKAKRCDGQKDLMNGARPECKTDFGIMDMVGGAMEWTASDWERGTPSGHRVVRGARAEKVSWLSARCAHPRKRDPNEAYGDVGFRCCSGKPNSARVVVEQKERTTVETDPDIEDAFKQALLKGLPADHREVAGVKLDFSEVYRWHPADNEELVVAIWQGTPEDGSRPFHEVAVFTVCSGRAWLSTKMKGPVETIGKPKVGVHKGRLSFEVQTGANRDDLEMRYWYGDVKITKEPEFIQKGNRLGGATDAAIKPGTASGSGAIPGRP